MIDLKGLFSKDIEKAATAIGDAFDKNFTSKEEREIQKLEALKELNRHLEVSIMDATKQLELILSDKQSAREMYKANSSLQKIYAIVFLIAYVVMSGAMCYAIFHLNGNIKLPDWGIGFISTIWGAMSMKVGTVTDFLFGASMTPDKKE
jgi:hypothetical protein